MDDHIALADSAAQETRHGEGTANQDVHAKQEQGRQAQHENMHANGRQSRCAAEPENMCVPEHDSRHTQQDEHRRVREIGRHSRWKASGTAPEDVQLKLRQLLLHSLGELDSLAAPVTQQQVSTKAGAHMLQRSLSMAPQGLPAKLPLPVQPPSDCEDICHDAGLKLRDIVPATTARCPGKPIGALAECESTGDGPGLKVHDTGLAAPDKRVGKAPENSLKSMLGKLHKLPASERAKVLMLLQKLPGNPAGKPLKAVRMEDNLPVKPDGMSVGLPVSHACKSPEMPTSNHTHKPLQQPTIKLSGQPLRQPTVMLADKPRQQPTVNLTHEPAQQPTTKISDKPPQQPTGEHTGKLLQKPTVNMTHMQQDRLRSSAAATLAKDNSLDALRAAMEETARRVRDDVHSAKENDFDAALAAMQSNVYRADAERFERGTADHEAQDSRRSHSTSRYRRRRHKEHRQSRDRHRELTLASSSGGADADIPSSSIYASGGACEYSSADADESERYGSRSPLSHKQSWAHSYQAGLCHSPACQSDLHEHTDRHQHARNTPVQTANETAWLVTAPLQWEGASYIPQSDTLHLVVSPTQGGAAAAAGTRQSATNSWHPESEFESLNAARYHVAQQYTWAPHQGTILPTVPANLAMYQTSSSMLHYRSMLLDPVPSIAPHTYHASAPLLAAQQVHTHQYNSTASTSMPFSLVHQAATPLPLHDASMHSSKLHNPALYPSAAGPSTYLTPTWSVDAQSVRPAPPCFHPTALTPGVQYPIESTLALASNPHHPSRSTATRDNNPPAISALPSDTAGELFGLNLQSILQFLQQTGAAQETRQVANLCGELANQQAQRSLACLANGGTSQHVGLSNKAAVATAPGRSDAAPGNTGNAAGMPTAGNASMAAEAHQTAVLQEFNAAAVPGTTDNITAVPTTCAAASAAVVAESNAAAIKAKSHTVAMSGIAAAAPATAEADASAWAAGTDATATLGNTDAAVPTEVHAAAVVVAETHAGSTPGNLDAAVLPEIHAAAVAAETRAAPASGSINAAVAPNINAAAVVEKADLLAMASTMNTAVALNNVHAGDVPDIARDVDVLQIVAEDAAATDGAVRASFVAMSHAVPDVLPTADKMALSTMVDVMAIENAGHATVRSGLADRVQEVYGEAAGLVVASTAVVDSIAPGEPVEVGAAIAPYHGPTAAVPNANDAPAGWYPVGRPATSLTTVAATAARCSNKTVNVPDTGQGVLHSTMSLNCPNINATSSCQTNSSSGTAKLPVQTPTIPKALPAAMHGIDPQCTATSATPKQPSTEAAGLATHNTVLPSSMQPSKLPAATAFLLPNTGAARMDPSLLAILTLTVNSKLYARNATMMNTTSAAPQPGAANAAQQHSEPNTLNSAPHSQQQDPSQSVMMQAAGSWHVARSPLASKAARDAPSHPTAAASHAVNSQATTNTVPHHRPLTDLPTEDPPPCHISLSCSPTKAGSCVTARHQLLSGAGPHPAQPQPTGPLSTLIKEHSSKQSFGSAKQPSSHSGSPPSSSLQQVSVAVSNLTDDAPTSELCWGCNTVAGATSMPYLWRVSTPSTLSNLAATLHHVGAAWAPSHLHHSPQRTGLSRAAGKQAIWSKLAPLTATAATALSCGDNAGTIQPSTVIERHAGTVAGSPVQPMPAGQLGSPAAGGYIERHSDADSVGTPAHAVAVVPQQGTGGLPAMAHTACTAAALPGSTAHTAVALPAYTAHTMHPTAASTAHTARAAAAPRAKQPCSSTDFSSLAPKKAPRKRRKQFHATDVSGTDAGEEHEDIDEQPLALLCKQPGVAVQAVSAGTSLVSTAAVRKRAKVGDKTSAAAPAAGSSDLAGAKHTAIVDHAAAAKVSDKVSSKGGAAATGRCAAQDNSAKDISAAKKSCTAGSGKGVLTTVALAAGCTASVDISAAAVAGAGTAAGCVGSRALAAGAIAAGGRKAEGKAAAVAQQWVKLKRNMYVGRSAYTVKSDAVSVCGCSPDGNCGPECLNRMLLIECTPGYCPCGDNCTNQVIQKRQSAKYVVAPCGEKGMGVVADEDIPAGTFVEEYIGEVVCVEEVGRRLQKYRAMGLCHTYIMNLGGSEVIDATLKAGRARFANHSCDPNCETQKWQVKGELHVAIVSTKLIRKGEEVTYNYNYDWLGGEPTVCRCAAANCVGFLGAQSPGFKDRVQRNNGKPMQGSEDSESESGSISSSDGGSDWDSWEESEQSSGEGLEDKAGARGGKQGKVARARLVVSRKKGAVVMGVAIKQTGRDAGWAGRKAPAARAKKAEGTKARVASSSGVGLNGGDSAQQNVSMEDSAGGLQQSVSKGEPVSMGDNAGGFQQPVGKQDEADSLQPPAGRGDSAGSSLPQVDQEDNAGSLQTAVTRVGIVGSAQQPVASTGNAGSMPALPVGRGNDSVSPKAPWGIMDTTCFLHPASSLGKQPTVASEKDAAILRYTIAVAGTEGLPSKRRRMSRQLAAAQPPSDEQSKRGFFAAGSAAEVAEAVWNGDGRAIAGSATQVDEVLQNDSTTAAAGGKVAKVAAMVQNGAPDDSDAGAFGLADLAYKGATDVVDSALEVAASVQNAATLEANVVDVAAAAQNGAVIVVAGNGVAIATAVDVPQVSAVPDAPCTGSNRASSAVAQQSPAAAAEANAVKHVAIAGIGDGMADGHVAAAGVVTWTVPTDATAGAGVVMHIGDAGGSAASHQQCSTVAAANSKQVSAARGHSAYPAAVQIHKRKSDFGSGNARKASAAILAGSLAHQSCSAAGGAVGSAVQHSTVGDSIQGSQDAAAHAKAAAGADNRHAAGGAVVVGTASGGVDTGGGVVAMDTAGGGVDTAGSAVAMDTAAGDADPARVDAEAAGSAVTVEAVGGDVDAAGGDVQHAGLPYLVAASGFVKSRCLASSDVDATSGNGASARTAITFLLAGIGAKIMDGLTMPQLHRGIKAGMEAGAKAGMQAGMEAGSEAGMQAGMQAGMEAGKKGGREAGKKAGMETGMEAGMQTATPDDSRQQAPATAGQSGQLAREPAAAAVVEGQHGPAVALSLAAAARWSRCYARRTLKRPLAVLDKRSAGHAAHVDNTDVPECLGSDGIVCPTGNVQTDGNAQSRGRAGSWGSVQSGSNAQSNGHAGLKGNASSCGSAQLDGNAQSDSNAQLDDNVKPTGNVLLDDDPRSGGNAESEGNAPSYSIAQSHDNDSADGTPRSDASCRSEGKVQSDCNARSNANAGLGSNAQADHNRQPGGKPQLDSNIPVSSAVPLNDACGQMPPSKRPRLVQSHGPRADPVIHRNPYWPQGRSPTSIGSKDLFCTKKGAGSVGTDTCRLGQELSQ